MRRLMLVLATLLLATLPLVAAGSVTVTTAVDPGNVYRYTVAWTSTAGGAVSANPITVGGGRLMQVKLVPNTAATQPTDLYDVTLVDADAADLLTVDGSSAGSNLSNATPKVVVYNPPILLRPGNTLDLTIANAGNAKTGTVTIWIQR